MYVRFFGRSPDTAAAGGEQLTALAAQTLVLANGLELTGLAIIDRGTTAYDVQLPFFAPRKPISVPAWRHSLADSETNA
jgi:hypothetical protein